MKKTILAILIFVCALFLRIFLLVEPSVGFLWHQPVSEFAVRLPSAFFGSLTILFLYFLLEELRKKALIITGKGIFSLPFWTAIFLLISPWHLNFSREIFGVNLMLFELILGLFFLFKFFNSGRKYLIYLSAIAFASTFFTFQSAQLITPILLLGLLFFFREEIKNITRRLKIIFTSVVLVGLLASSLMPFIGQAGGKVPIISFVSYQRSSEETNIVQSQDNFKKVPWAVFHSIPIFFTRSILGGYFNYFSPDFLFFKGSWPNAGKGLVYQGVIYYLDLVFIILAFYLIFSRPRKTAWENFMVFWLLISPLPAVLAGHNIFAAGSFSMVIPLIFFVSVGFDSFFGKAQHFKKPLRLFIILIPFVLYSFLFIRFLDLYLIHK